MTGRRSERGMAAAEMTLLLPVALVVLSFLVVAGRLGTVQGEIAAASRDAARAASQSQTWDQALAAATTTAEATLAARDVTCRTVTVELSDPATFTAGGRVSASVSCEVVLADVALPGLPGSRQVGATSTEPIDQYRGIGDPGATG